MAELTNKSNKAPKLNLIYIHGFDSTGKSIKGQDTREYCFANHPDIVVHTPNLNMKPQVVVEQMIQMIDVLKNTAPVVLIGSSFGGYFSTLLSNLTGVPAFLLNPSTEPYKTLSRFYLEDEPRLDDTVFYTTAGGWQVTYGDMKWVEKNAFAKVDGQGVTHPDKIAVLLTTGDEVIPYQIANTFYGSQAEGQGISKIHIVEGDNHRISQYDKHLPILMRWAMQWV